MANGQYLPLFLSSPEATIIACNDLSSIQTSDDYICLHCHPSNIATLKNINRLLMIQNELPEQDGQV